jgi:hypothetical protein
MPAWVWVLIAVAAAAVFGVVVWQGLARRRTGRLRSQFGPEYDRVVGSAEDKREGEAELAGRQGRRQNLEIKPLSAEAADRYDRSWRGIQAEFVDAPQAAVASADVLIIEVMGARGYPIEDFEQRAADVSVDHPQVVENYRAAHAIAARSAREEASTEDLRQALRHYRTLFEELLDSSGDEPLTRERATATDVATDVATSETQTTTPTTRE